MESTASAIITPGGSHNQGIDCSTGNDCASVSMFPQVAVGDPPGFRLRTPIAPEDPKVKRSCTTS